MHATRLPGQARAIRLDMERKGIRQLLNFHDVKRVGTEVEELGYK